MSTTKPATRACPACNAAVGPNARICPKCRLEVSKMAAFAAAKRAAAEKGMKKTAVEREKVPLHHYFIRPVVIIPVILVAVLFYYLTRPSPPPPWSLYPATPTDAARILMTDIAQDNNQANDHAYSLIAPSVRDPKQEDELGLYRQLFTTIDHYLANLATNFGNDWINHLTLEVDKDDTQVIDAHIGPETLHIRTMLQTPIAIANESNRHYAIVGFDDFSIADAGDQQTLEARLGVVRGLAGEGAVKNLQTIMGSVGGTRRHETPMQTKLRVLPNLRDPRVAVRRAVLHTWPIRKDPVIRSRLEQIVSDGRYAPDVQQTARDVLRDAVPEEDLTAVGIEQ